MPIGIYKRNKKEKRRLAEHARTVLVRFGEKNNKWKGDNVGYTGMHHWVSRHLGKPKKCEYCKSTKENKYEWANKSRDYKRDLSDWLRLCVKCHRKYDARYKFHDIKCIFCGKIFSHLKADKNRKFCSRNCYNLHKSIKKSCSVDNCESKMEVRGYCNKHYQRWKKYKDPLYSKKRTKGKRNSFIKVKYGK